MSVCEDITENAIEYALDETGALSHDTRALYLNGKRGPIWSLLATHNLAQAAQPFYPFSKPIDAIADYRMLHGNNTADTFDLVVISAPKSLRELTYLLWLGFSRLSEGGILICAAENNVNGKRLQKLALHAGWGEASTNLSKHKCRILIVEKQAGLKAPAEWEMYGTFAKNDAGFISLPGLFSWDRIDAGSKLLMEHIEAEDIRGNGGDFGCGYGYLSVELVRARPHLKSLSLYDADARALTAAEKNLMPLSGNIKIRTCWTDLTRPELHAAEGLDFIVMNPPFHEDSRADAAIGKGFILSAAKILKRGGVLWMVANRHMPYETDLRAQFKEVKKVIEANGYKIFRCVR